MKKQDLPAIPFYAGDWFKALDVQALPRNIRMTWFEMILRMWESKDRGYLAVNGQPLSSQELSQLLGFGNDISECEKHINFLEKKRIFSRKKNGVIYCRRMVRDEAISKKRAKAGKKGMKSRYNKDEICYNKTANKTITNTEIENENESNVINVFKEGGVGETSESKITEERVVKYFEKNNYEAKAAVIFFNYYNSQDWMTGGANPRKIKDWKSKARECMMTPSKFKWLMGLEQEGYYQKGNNNGSNQQQSAGSVKSRLDYKFDPNKTAKRAEEIDHLFSKRE